MRPFLLALAASSLLLSQGIPQPTPRVDPALAPYVPVRAITTVVESIGADSLTDVWEEWKAGFKVLQPGAQFKVNNGLSTTAVKAFMENAPMIHMARELTVEEHKAFEKKFGYAPTKVVACYDAFIVFVNMGNPIKDIGMDQLDAAYSTTRNGGYKSDSTVETWGDLGVRGSDFSKRPIHAYMRVEGTASRTTIQDLVLLKGKYKPTVKDAVDWPSIAEAVMTDASGIGIGTLSNWLTRNKTLAVTPLQAKDPVPPTQEDVVSGKYPLSRTYYLYVNRAPGTQLPPAIAEFLSYVLSRQGQEAVALASLFPLPLDIAQLNRKRLRAN